MENELGRRVGKYWLLYYQPLPEAGERIVIALVFEDSKGGAAIEYDPTFAKAAKVFPNLDSSSFEFFLDGLRVALVRASSVETVIGMYGPQVAASVARKIAVPVTRSAIEVLMTKFVYPAKKTRQPSKKKVDKVAQEIEAYVRGQIGSGAEMKTNVTASDIVGRPIAGTKPIALAIHGKSEWILVDGIDLNQLSPAAAISRANDISRTYWNSSRDKGALGEGIRSVGVVLNGHSHLVPATSEAHDYALHQFSKDADLALDAASTESGNELRMLLASLV